MRKIIINHHFMKRRNGRCDVYESVPNPAFIVLLYLIERKEELQKATKKTSPKKTITLASTINQPPTHPHIQVAFPIVCKFKFKPQKPKTLSLHCDVLFLG